MRMILLLGMWLLMAVGCSQSEPVQAEIDYSNSDCWYDNHVNVTTHDVDFFYLVPTCIWDYQDSTDQTITHHHMDIFNAAQRKLVNPSIALAKQVFADSCNFYSPYYRQISMDSWLTLNDSLINSRMELAYHDAARAFHYYLDHLNQGRPFILGGHSQGAKLVIELLKREFTPALRRQLVAAYAVGYSITSEELARHPELRIAADSTDVGVLIGFNSVTRPEGVSPLFRDNVVCINPLNWRTDATPATLPTGCSSVASQGFTAAIDPAIHTLVVEGLNDADYYIPSVAALLPEGNLHVYEFPLYEQSLRKNVMQRINAYRQKK